jgi:hypothetical protein
VDLGWPHRRCILCCRELSDEVPFSRAHLIPQAIGGFLWAWTKCKECNDRAGSDIEAAVVRDDSIILSVNALRDELPELAARFDARTRFVAQSDHGLVEARRQGDDFEILTTRDDETTIRQSIEDARGGLERRLQRHGYSTEEIAAALELFDTAEAGVPFEVAGDTYTHGSVQDFNLPFDGEPVSDAFPSLIAFHFLALYLGEVAYDPSLNDLRAAIRRGEARSDWHAAEGGIDRTAGYQPSHLVGIAQTDPHMVARVQLFGWNVWRVHFTRIATKTDPLGMLLDLKSKSVAPAKPRALTTPLVPPT